MGRKGKAKKRPTHESGSVVANEKLQPPPSQSQPQPAPQALATPVESAIGTSAMADVPPSAAIPLPDTAANPLDNSPPSAAANKSNKNKKKNKKCAGHSEADALQQIPAIAVPVECEQPHALTEIECSGNSEQATTTTTTTTAAAVVAKEENSANIAVETISILPNKKSNRKNKKLKNGTPISDVTEMTKDEQVQQQPEQPQQPLLIDLTTPIVSEPVERVPDNVHTLPSIDEINLEHIAAAAAAASSSSSFTSTSTFTDHKPLFFESFLNSFKGTTPQTDEIPVLAPQMTATITEPAELLDHAALDSIDESFEMVKKLLQISERPTEPCETVPTQESIATIVAVDEPESGVEPIEHKIDEPVERLNRSVSIEPVQTCQQQLNETLLADNTNIAIAIQTTSDDSVAAIAEVTQSAGAIKKTIAVDNDNARTSSFFTIGDTNRPKFSDLFSGSNAADIVPMCPVPVIKEIHADVDRSNCVVDLPVALPYNELIVSGVDQCSTHDDDFEIINVVHDLVEPEPKPESQSQPKSESKTITVDESPAIVNISGIVGQYADETGTAIATVDQCVPDSTDTAKMTASLKSQGPSKTTNVLSLSECSSVPFECKPKKSKSPSKSRPPIVASHTINISTDGSNPQQRSSSSFALSSLSPHQSSSSPLSPTCDHHPEPDLMPITSPSPPPPPPALSPSPPAQPPLPLSSSDDEEYIEYTFAPRQVFLATICQVCQTPLKTFTVCKLCQVVWYCGEDHLAADVSTHRGLCTTIQEIAKKRGGHIYNNARILSDEDFRKLRIHTLTLCASLLKRPLQPFEKEMLLYPRICSTTSCREWRPHLLEQCTKCGQVSFCSAKPDHLSDGHSQWCDSFVLYRNLVVRQKHCGRIEPPLPGRIFKKPYTIGDDDDDEQHNIDHIFKDLYKSNSLLKDECVYVSLTQLATAPLTALDAVQRAGIQMHEEFTIHLIGAELQFEGDTLDKWESFFLHLTPQIIQLRIVFVGPELNTENLPINILSRIRMCRMCRHACRAVKFDFQCGKFYHEYCRLPNFTRPNLICFFNAGLYRETAFNGLDSWPDTIRSAAAFECPIVVTAYTDYEAPLDYARLQTEAGRPLKIIKPLSRNRFASKRPDRNFISDEIVPMIFKNFNSFVVT